MISSGSFHRRRSTSWFRNYYFCWALPLLRLCLTPRHHHNLGQTVLPRVRTFATATASFPFCIAFSPSATSTRKTFTARTTATLRSSNYWSAVGVPRRIVAGEQGVAQTRLFSTAPDWPSFRVVELKEELRKRGLRVSGRKAELVALLEQDDLEMARKSARTSSGRTNASAGDTTTRQSPRKKQKTTAAATKASPKPTSNSPKKKTPTKKAADHQRITDIDDLPKLWTNEMAEANGSYTFKIASWNVAGLRALVKKSPNALAELCEKHDLDMLCLQEHKLQEMHLEDPKMKLKGLLEDTGYDEHYACSTAKKGYSGTCVFVRRRGTAGTANKKQGKIGSFFAPKTKEAAGKKCKSKGKAALPVNPELLVPTAVSFSVGEEIDNEGRVVLLDFPWATIANVYVPNSGQKLERLDYRTNQWDKFFLKFMQDKQAERGVPVMWLGDLNIAHKAYDIWNNGAKHLAKQAGVTEQERLSFDQQLEAGFVDVFRKLHPDAKGNYSYWSQRAGNREPNKGLRLDYFVASEEMFLEDSKVIPRDSYMIMDQLGSDHAPVVLELEIKG
ncbi:unnamed protein product [Pseudo-nitzschia multistriata]|uniref:DNA-(apurinic or apyrimidinic site) endonuclease n=1 Tax=Pseudo-nitzschia multistriata TaxID=183589 RepID=A0A448ZKQ4_9STRA|nr:unnamed protein product [Pseudo-nitzschia multistriata]